MTRERYADTAFSGEGARKYGGRFNRPETALVYTASSLALAVLEVMANVDDYDLLTIDRLTAIPARVPAELIKEVAVTGPVWRAGDIEATVTDWRSEPPPRGLQELGSRWADRQISPALRVPSAVIPHEDNVLLSPHHPNFGAIEVGAPIDPLIDPRLTAG